MENIFNNLQEFYKYRNYILDEEINFNEFNKNLRLDGFGIQLLKTPSGDGIVIICEYDFLTKVSEFKKLLILFNKKIKLDKLLTFKHILFIGENGFGNAVDKALVDIFTETYGSNGKSLISNDRVENLKFDHFRAIIPLGQYCSKHTILTKEEADKLLKSLHVSKINLPTIHFNDPQIIWIGASRGDIIHIDRLSESTGKSDYYRYVI